MKQRVLLLSHDDRLAAQLLDELNGLYELVICRDLSELEHHRDEDGTRAVVVQLSAATIEGATPGRYIGELIEAVENSPLYALIGADCPARLRRMAEKSSDLCLPLPLEVGQLAGVLDQRRDVADGLQQFWRDVPHKELVGKSRSMVTFTPELFDTLDELQVAARHDVTLLLVGETGSGKTYLARLLHELSQRADGPCCTVACGALPPDLLESELFGYVQGAFTGADRNREGKLAAAGAGTLLLDEIDVLPLKQQASLLRVIETGEYEPVGSNETKHLAARLIVATNNDLGTLVEEGRFRSDLFYRLNMLSFFLPPLRQRPWDLEYLARKFALEFSQEHNVPVREIEPGFFESLSGYSWLGNVRELKNVMQRAVLYSKRGVLTETDLPRSVRSGALPLPNPELPLPTATAPDETPITLEKRVGMLEQRIIEDTLRRNNQRRKETAQELGINRVTLYNKMKKFGLLNSEN